MHIFSLETNLNQIFNEKMQASGLTEFIPFICVSAIWGQPCFLAHLASCIPPAPQQSTFRWQHLLDHSLGSSHSH